MSRRTPLLALMLTATTASGCAYVEDGFIWRPLEGPGYDAAEGLLFEPEPDETFVVAATFLPVSKSGRSLFSEHMEEIQAALDAEPDGLVAYSLAQRLAKREYRTVTIWESEDAMMDFVLSDAHGAAMGDGADIRDPDKEARVVRWQITPDELPLEWEDVMDRTDLDGRQVLY